MIVFLISVVAIFVLFFIKNYSKPKEYPPGPVCFPFIGSWYTVPGQGLEKKVSEWRKKYGNIIGLRMGHENLVVISGYKEAASALKHDNFQNRIHTTTFTSRTFNKVLGLFFGDGEQYSEVRRFTLRFLGQAATTKLESVTHEEMMNLFSTIKSGKITQVDSEFTSFAMNILFIILIGDSTKFIQKETKTFRELVNQSFRNGCISGIENFYPWLGMFFQHKSDFMANTYVQDFFKDRLKEHRKSFDPENIRDYIDAFLVEQEKERLMGETEYYTDEELISCAADMGKASSESTGNTAAFLLMYVALHPHVQDKMHTELDSVLGGRFPAMKDKSSMPYCCAVIEETMRINSVASSAVQHVATEDTKFYGYIIPKGTTMLIQLWEMFRNSNDFDDPLSFKPERFASKEVKSKIISFGLGKRSCVGESIVKKTLFLFVTYFFQKYSIALPKGYEPNTEPLLGFTNCPKPFYLTITERQSR